MKSKSGAFLNGDGAGDGAFSIIIRRRGIDFTLKVAAPAILFANALPAAFDGHSVGHVTWFQADERSKGNGRNESVSLPLNSFPMVNGASSDRNEDRDLTGKFLVGIASQADFRRTKFGTEISFLLVDRANLLEKKQINGRAGIRLIANVG